MRQFFQIFMMCLFITQLSACAVVSVVDTAVSTTVKVGGAVVGTAVDVTQAGVHAVTGSGHSDKDGDKKNTRDE